MLEAVITMLPKGQHVLTVWTDILRSVPKGTLLIDSSTIDVDSAHARPHAMADDAGCLSLDAPVSGGTGGAAAGTLTFMAGGSPESFEGARPLLEVMGRKIVHCGEWRRWPGSEDLQQHDPRHFHDRCLRSLRARRKARLVAPSPVRRCLDVLGPMLVDQHLLPGARARADLARQQRL